MKAFAIAALVLLSTGASAENFVSNKLGFTADFPGVVQAGDPQPSETDAKGNVVSTVTTVKSELSGSYSAMVTVEIYAKPATVDASAARAMINAFVAQLDATVTSSKAGMVDGNKARFFSYEMRNGNGKGSGIVVIVGAKKPRVYQVFTMHTPAASPGDIAALEKFLKSFQLD